MGDTIWVLAEGTEEDNWDHSLMLRQEKGLDRLCSAMGVTKLSKFFDFSSYAEEYGADVAANYVDPAEAMKTLSALVEAIRNSHPDYEPERTDELLEELIDVESKLEIAKANGKRVRLSLVQ